MPARRALIRSNASLDFGACAGGSTEGIRPNKNRLKRGERGGRGAKPPIAEEFLRALRVLKKDWLFARRRFKTTANRQMRPARFGAPKKSFCAGRSTPLR